MTRHVTVGGVLLAALVLAGCGSPTESSAFDAAWETCVSAYEELPHSLEVLEDQGGEDVTVETPCQNWVDSQGEDGFTDFWTDPEEYMPYVIAEGKLEALAELQ